MPFDWGAANQPELTRLGGALDVSDPAIREANSVQMAFEVLRVRSRTGETIPLAANRAQREYEKNRGQSNIILKARQVGMTTWVAGQFFLKTITHPGTLTVQVAHTQEAAESIFRIVQRFLRCLPASLCQGALKTSLVSARRMIFPGMDSEYRVETAGAPNAGRGLTITNLHCSEVARWPGDAAEILQGMRAGLSPKGELVLESTPMRAAGCFWKEWQDAEKTGMVQHFFPWWLEDAYVGRAVEETSLNDAERTLTRKQGLSAEQIGYRRNLQASFRGLARQEYAEDATECFLASGECIFDTAAIDTRLREVRPPLEERENQQRNNHGSGVLAYLKGVCRYERLHAMGGQDGWLTSSMTRPQMLGRLGSALVESPQIFSSDRLLRECRSFVRHSSGRAEAQAGEHDDCVMAMAIALTVREERLTGRALK